jgi:N6-adenosine-specific RNA methylase IME4
VILADPAWWFEVYDPDSGSERAAGSHYPCMRTEDICALPVAQLATDDAMLFLWVPPSQLPAASRVIEAWGFDYVTQIVWVKDQIGLGFYVRNKHELLLIAKRGNMPTPLPANRPPSVIHAPRREHSRKPDVVYDLIERMYPELPRIELFARQARAGWQAWGNEAPATTTTSSPAPAPTTTSLPAPSPSMEQKHAHAPELPVEGPQGEAAPLDDGIPPFLRRTRQPEREIEA